MDKSTLLIVDLPKRSFAKASVDAKERRIFFEAARDDVVDREGEIVAIDGLWKSRELMLEQGDFDISHWAHLPNPLTGRPQPEYRIGHPTQIKRQGKGLFVAGAIFQSDEQPPTHGPDPFWPDYFWHSVAVQEPAAKWFPSVYGQIKKGGIEMVTIKGQRVRRITSVEWYSVGFALRAQHPELPAVSLSPVGNLVAKSQQFPSGHIPRDGVLHLPWRAFAKAVAEVGQPITDHAALEGVQALTKESVEGKPKLAARQITKVLRAIKSGDVSPNKKEICAYLRRSGLDHSDADMFATKVMNALNERSR